MKKIATLFLSLLIAVALFAQTTDDALNLAQEYYEGTARSMAMGNAFTALGGDLGAISINPASSGVLRYSQITFTPSLTTTVHNTGYLGHTNSTRNTGLTVSNLGTVLNFDTGNYNGLLNYSFGFVYNKKNSFRSNMAAEGTTNNSSMLSSIAAGLEGVNWESIDLEKTANPYVSSIASWPGILAWNTYVLAPISTLSEEFEGKNSYIASTENYYGEINEDGYPVLPIGGDLNQRFNRKTRGSNEEYALNFGGNFSDFLYFGMNLNIHTVSQTTEEYYEEVASNPSQFQDGFVSMDNSFWLRTVGSGINFKAGVIVTPFAGLRLGATVTTPTWYTLTDEWDYTMNTAFNNGNTYTGYSPTGTYVYKLKTPMRWSVGAAYTFLDKGLLSVDYESVNYAATRFSEERGGAGNFAEVDNAIKDNFTNAHILRVGAEIRASDFLSIRGGYQQYSPAVKGGASRNAYSAGLGFNISPTFSIDLAWTRLAGTTETFQLYDDYSSAVTVPTGTNWHSMSKAVCTLAIKF